MAGRWDAAHRTWSSQDGLWAIQRVPARRLRAEEIPACWELTYQGRYVARGGSYLALRLAIGDLASKSLPRVG